MPGNCIRRGGGGELFQHRQEHRFGRGRTLHRALGYVTIKPDLSRGRGQPPKAESIVRPTEAGRKAQEIWRPLEKTLSQRGGGAARRLLPLSSPFLEVPSECCERYGYSSGNGGGGAMTNENIWAHYSAANPGAREAVSAIISRLRKLPMIILY